MRKNVILLGSALALLFSATNNLEQAQAQTDETTKTKIDIQIFENGKHVEIQQELDGEDFDLQKILGELDVLKDLDLDGEENIDVIIRKGSSDDKNFFFKEHAPMHGRGAFIGEAGDKGFLGVHITSVSGGETAGGTAITNVIEGSGAEKAGLLEGDIITEIDGKKIGTHEDLVSNISARKKGETVLVTYLREGSSNTVSATLGERTMPTWLEHRIENENGNEVEEFIWNGEVAGDDAQEHIENMLRSHKRFQFIEEGKQPEDRAFLGVNLGITEGESKGVLVKSVIETTTAEEMGLQDGDLIQSINGTKVTSMEELTSALSNMKPQDEVTVNYLRNNKKGSATGILKSRAECKPIMNPHNIPWPPAPCNEVVRINIKMNKITPEETQQLQDAGVQISNTNNLEFETLEINPNPSTGIFNLDFMPKEQGKVNLIVLDISGREVYKNTLGEAPVLYSEKIDLSNQPDGIYFLMVTQGQNQFNSKIVKQ